MAFPLKHTQMCTYLLHASLCMNRKMACEQKGSWRTCMGENVPFEVVTTAESTIAVLAYEILLHLRAEWDIVINIRNLHLHITYRKKNSIQSGYEYERKCVNVINRQNHKAILQTDWTHAWGFSLILVGSPDFLFFFFGCTFWLACMSFSSKSLEEWNSPSLRMSCSKTEYISHRIECKWFYNIWS